MLKANFDNLAESYFYRYPEIFLVFSVFSIIFLHEDDKSYFKQIVFLIFVSSKYYVKPVKSKKKIFGFVKLGIYAVLSQP